MKNKIIIAIALTFLTIISTEIKAYAAEAKAYASVLIIIPAREENTQAEVVKGEGEEEKGTENKVASAKDSRES